MSTTIKIRSGVAWLIMVMIALTLCVSSYMAYSDIQHYEMMKAFRDDLKVYQASSKQFQDIMLDITAAHIIADRSKYDVSLTVDPDGNTHYWFIRKEIDYVEDGESHRSQGAIGEN
jgi:hypothetical protein